MKTIAKIIAFVACASLPVAAFADDAKKDATADKKDEKAAPAKKDKKDMKAADKDAKMPPATDKAAPAPAEKAPAAK
jgi:hypothetical protein